MVVVAGAVGEEVEALVMEEQVVLGMGPEVVAVQDTEVEVVVVVVVEEAEVEVVLATIRDPDMVRVMDPGTGVVVEGSYHKTME